MNFNKIKNLLNGGPENIIRKALSRSTVLEMSEDQTSVKRKDDAPLKTQDEIDECTIYVEQIPINSSHESISSIFSRFGKDFIKVLLSCASDVHFLWFKVR